MGDSGYEELPDNAHSNGLDSSIVVSGAHALVGFTVNNTNTAAQYLQVFDAATLPDDGAAPAVEYTMSAGTDKPIQYLPPRKMLRGIVLCNSTTAGTKTLGAADCYFDVQYV